MRSRGRKESKQFLFIGFSMEIFYRIFSLVAEGFEEIRRVEYYSMNSAQNKLTAYKKYRSCRKFAENALF